MGDTPVTVRIDLQKLGGRLLDSELIRSQPRVESWLAANGFVRHGDIWRPLSATDLAVLEPDEYLIENETGVFSSPAESLPNDPRPTLVRCNAEPFLVPRLLAGKHRDAAKKWKDFLRENYRGLIDSAFQDLVMIDLAQTDYAVIMDGPSPLMTGEHYRAYLTIDVLVERFGICKTPAASERYKNFILAASEHPWFCLGIVALRSGGIFPPCTGLKKQSPQLSRALLVKTLKVLDRLLQISPKFHFGTGFPLSWQYWSSPLKTLSVDAGIPWEIAHAAMEKGADEFRSLVDGQGWESEL